MLLSHNGRRGWVLIPLELLWLAALQAERLTEIRCILVLLRLWIHHISDTSKSGFRMGRWPSHDVSVAALELVGQHLVAVVPLEVTGMDVLHPPLVGF